MAKDVIGAWNIVFTACAITLKTNRFDFFAVIFFIVFTR